ncbi:hypothetical protein F5Y03DRAFT_90777 [Xylaria venustula]|nr:hypothetical protein F5Y03DRAFT_90777 [Xylaria venustula]
MMIGVCLVRVGRAIKVLTHRTRLSHGGVTIRVLVLLVLSAVLGAIGGLIINLPYTPHCMMLALILFLWGNTGFGYCLAFPTRG